MHYTFPHIRHIDDVLPVIKDHPNFIVAEKDDYTVINYLLANEETFPHIECKEHIIMRECRGLIFDKQGNLISRPYHKFFNVGERLDTQNIDLSRPHVLLSKLDGSMIRNLHLKHGVRLGTKMGITDTSMNAENFIVDNPHYMDFINAMYDKGLTTIFEWCSRKNRIVIDYPQDRLILTALRDILTGEYVSFHAMQQLAADFHIDCVEGMVSTTRDISKIVEYIRKNEDSEGIVIRFDDGSMAKVKSDWYVRIHKAKEKILQEKNLISVILHEESDDLKAMLPKEDGERIIFYEKAISEGINATVKQVESILAEGKAKYTERKDFALWIKATVSPELTSIVFKALDGVNVREFLIDKIKKSCNNEANLSKVRSYMGLTKEMWLQWQNPIQ